MATLPFTDGDYTEAGLIKSVPRRIYPNLGLHSNYLHEQSFRQATDSYCLGSLDGIEKRFDWSSGVDGVSAFFGAVTGNNDSVTDDNGTLYDNCLKLYADSSSGTHYAFHDVVSGQGVKYKFSGRYYIPSSQTNVDGFLLFSDNDSVLFSTVGEWTTFETDFITFSATTTDCHYRLTSGGSPTFTGAGSSSDDLIYLVDIAITTADSKITDYFWNPSTKTYNRGWLVQDVLTAEDRGYVDSLSLFAEEFDDIVSGGSSYVNIFDPNGLKSGTSYAVTHQADRFRVYADRIAIQNVGSLDEVKTINQEDIKVEPEGDFTFTYTDASTTTVDLTQTADQIKSEMNTELGTVGGATTPILSVNKSGSKIEIYPSVSIDNPNNWSHNFSGITAGYSALATWELYDIDAAGTNAYKFVIVFTKNRSIISGDLTITYTDASTTTVDLTQTADQIKSEMNTELGTVGGATTPILSVNKSGSRVEIYPVVSIDNPNNWSVNVVDIEDEINYQSIWELYDIDAAGTNAYRLLINFVDERQISQSITNQNQERPFNITSHGKSAGDKIAVFNGDELIAISQVSSVTDANNLYLPLSDVPGEGLQATHVGGNTWKEYSLIGSDRHLSITRKFYIPGITTGITTFADIPSVQGDDTAQEQLDAIVNADTYLQVTGSVLTQEAPNLYSRTVTEAVTAEVFPVIEESP